MGRGTIATFAAVAALCGACFDPVLPAVACGPLGQCPPNLTCDPVDDMCRIAPLADAASPDALPESDSVAHVADMDADPGDIDMTTDESITIDTTELSVIDFFGNPVVADFDTVAQTGDGPELAVLRVATFRVTLPVSVVGTRPLVIIASGDVDIENSITAGGAGSVSGPGASSSGAGDVGSHVGTGFEDGGGGGGGFGTPGAPGGDGAGVEGGSPGTEYGDAELTILAGGGHGGDGGSGDPKSCSVARGGGSGGAIQISTPMRIHVTSAGSINAGGGGGDGGRQCGAPTISNWTAGAGGGSGGAIYLQAGAIDIDGVVAANGGGGGGGAGDAGDGNPGTNGRAGGSPASGGQGVTGTGTAGGDGGDGGTGTADAGGGGDIGASSGNGGGGGGGAGRIVLRAPSRATSGTISPTATLVDP